MAIMDLDCTFLIWWLPYLRQIPVGFSYCCKIEMQIRLCIDLVIYLIQLVVEDSNENLILFLKSCLKISWYFKRDEEKLEFPVIAISKYTN